MSAPPIALAAPTARQVVRSALPLYAVVIVTPTALAIAQGHRDIAPSVTFAALAGGAAAGFALVDDLPSLAATPVDRSRRRIATAVFVVLAVLIAWGAVTVAGHVTDADIGHPSALLPEVVAAAGLSLAAVAAASWADVGASAAGAAVATLVAMATSTALGVAIDELRWLPVVARAGDANRWWVVAIVSLGVTARLARDPASGRRRPGRDRTVLR